MNGPGRHIEGWSRATTPYSSTLKIVSPAKVQTKSGGSSNAPPIPMRQQAYNPPRFYSPRYRDIRYHQPNHSNQGQVQIPRYIPQAHSNIQSPRPQKLPESFKESLLIVDDDPNPPKGITAEGSWKSRQVRIQEPSLKSVNRSRAQAIPYEAQHSSSSRSNFQHSNSGLMMLPPRPHYIQPGNSLYNSSSSPPYHSATGPPQAQSLRNIPNFNTPSETRHFISSSNANAGPSMNFNLDRPLFSRSYFSPLATPGDTAGSALQTGYINLDYLQYLQLSRLAIEDQIVFRVHSQSNVSPLVWSGDMKTSGFFATSSVFQRLTPKSYEALFRSYQPDQRKDNEGWLTRPLMREVIIDHILCRPSKRFITVRLDSVSDISKMAKEPGREGEREDYWISTTRSVDWAIFEIARRLSMYLVSGGREGDREVRLTVISKHSNLSNGNGNVVKDKTRERTVDPYFCLKSHENNILSPSKLEASIHARQRAKESYEILYWGRIFGENIQQDLVFNTEYLPFKLPSKFWKSPSAISPSLPGWLGRLRWNPIKDDWHSAVRCLRDKIYPTTKWEKQTVHDLGSTWPPTTSPDATPDRSQKDAIGANSDPMLKVVSDTEADTDQFGSSRSGEVSLGGSRDKGSKEVVADFMA
ncbi:hypothetical protein V865_001411 [Kwoniella europaea PYCC6329]|uniref:Decapping nuclease n=1 Tax=Kwoniella europaea PYCC6329 TaxID=1423913 RepID=A0AAX4KBP0_9TREE